VKNSLEGKKSQKYAEEYQIMMYADKIPNNVSGAMMDCRIIYYQ